MLRQQLIIACLLAAAFCMATSTNKKTSVASTECSENYVMCQSSGECIYEDYMCDGVSDCDDNSDEPDSCQTQANVQTTDPLPNEKLQELNFPCYRTPFETEELCGKHPFDQLFLNHSPREIYHKLVQTDLHEICRVVHPWVGCISNDLNNCAENNSPFLKREKLILKAAESALHYTCVEEIDAINSHKACLLKEVDQEQGSMEPVLELFVRISRTCFHLIEEIRPAYDYCYPSDLKSCVIQVVADQCGNEIATVLEGLSDRVHHALNCSSDRVGSLPVYNRRTGFSMYKNFFKFFL